MTEDTGTDSTEMVELHEADDADIDSFLENAIKAESGEVAPEAQVDAEPKQEQEAEPLATNQSQPVTREEFDRYAKQLQGQELLLKRRTSEIGDLKQKLAQIVRANRENLDEVHLESPSEAVERQLIARDAEREIAKLDIEETKLQKQATAQKLLAQYAGPEGFDVAAMAESLRADGMPEDYLQGFIQSVYTAAEPETLIQLAKRAQAEKRLRELEGLASELLYYNQKLVEEASKSPTRTLEKVQQAMRGGPSVTATSGGVGGTRGVNPTDISSLSDAELEQLLG